MKAQSDWCAAFPGREAVSKGLDSSFYKEYKEVKLLFEEAGDFFKKDISKLCYSQDGIDSKWQTVCIVIHCYAIYKVVIKSYGLPKALAGYSQGEFTACSASGAFPLLEMLNLIYRLEEILDNTKVNDEAMYRITDLDTSLLCDCCKQIDKTGKKVSISAYLSRDQNIISGKNDLIQEVIKLAKENGARWAINLKSNKAYHSPLCDMVAQEAKGYFNNIPVSNASIPVYSCYDGTGNIEGRVIRDKLSKQINHPIQWNKLIKNIADTNITTLVELGPGCTVSANSRLADNRINCKWIGKTEEI